MSDELHQQHATRNECIACRCPWPCPGWLARQIEAAKTSLNELPPNMRDAVETAVRAIERKTR